MRVFRRREKLTDTMFEDRGKKRTGGSPEHDAPYKDDPPPAWTTNLSTEQLEEVLRSKGSRTPRRGIETPSKSAFATYNKPRYHQSPPTVGPSTARPAGSSRRRRKRGGSTSRGSAGKRRSSLGSFEDDASSHISIRDERRISFGAAEDVVEVRRMLEQELVRRRSAATERAAMATDGDCDYSDGESNDDRLVASESETWRHETDVLSDDYGATEDGGSRRRSSRRQRLKALKEGIRSVSLPSSPMNSKQQPVTSSLSAPTSPVLDARLPELDESDGEENASEMMKLTHEWAKTGRVEALCAYLEAADREEEDEQQRTDEGDPLLNNRKRKRKVGWDVVNMRDDEGRTLVHHAVENGHHRLLSHLLDLAAKKKEEELEKEKKRREAEATTKIKKKKKKKKKKTEPGEGKEKEDEGEEGVNEEESVRVDEEKKEEHKRTKRPKRAKKVASPPERRRKRRSSGASGIRKILFSQPPVSDSGESSESGGSMRWGLRSRSRRRRVAAAAVEAAQHEHEQKAGAAAEEPEHEDNEQEEDGTHSRSPARSPRDKKGKRSSTTKKSTTSSQESDEGSSSAKTPITSPHTPKSQKNSPAIDERGKTPRRGSKRGRAKKKRDSSPTSPQQETETETETENGSGRACTKATANGEQADRKGENGSDDETDSARRRRREAETPHWSESKKKASPRSESIAEKKQSPRSAVDSRRSGSAVILPSTPKRRVKKTKSSSTTPTVPPQSMDEETITSPSRGSDELSPTAMKKKKKKKASGGSTEEQKTSTPVEEAVAPTTIDDEEQEKKTRTKKKKIAGKKKAKTPRSTPVIKAGDTTSATEEDGLESCSSVPQPTTADGSSGGDTTTINTIDDSKPEPPIVLRVFIDLNIQDGKGMTPLHLACKLGHTKIIKLLVLQTIEKIDVTLVTNKEDTVLHYLVRHFPVAAIVGSSLKRDKTKSQKNFSKKIMQYSELGRILIAKGCDPMHRNKAGNTALHVAAVYSSASAIRFLLVGDWEFDVNTCNNQAETALHLAVSAGSVESVETLLELEINDAAVSINGTALEMAKRQKRSDIIAILSTRRKPLARPTPSGSPMVVKRPVTPEDSLIGSSSSGGHRVSLFNRNVANTGSKTMGYDSTAEQEPPEVSGSQRHLLGFAGTSGGQTVLDNKPDGIAENKKANGGSSGHTPLAHAHTPASSPQQTSGTTSFVRQQQMKLLATGTGSSTTPPQPTPPVVPVLRKGDSFVGTYMKKFEARPEEKSITSGSVGTLTTSATTNTTPSISNNNRHNRKAEEVFTSKIKQLNLGQKEGQLIEDIIGSSSSNSEVVDKLKQMTKTDIGVAEKAPSKSSESTKGPMARAARDTKSETPPVAADSQGFTDDVLNELISALTPLTDSEHSVRTSIRKVDPTPPSSDLESNKQSSTVVSPRKKVVKKSKKKKAHSEKKNEDEMKKKTEEVRKWLVSLNLPVEYAAMLMGDGFDDLEAIRLVSEDDLRQVGIDKTGHRKKIMHWVMQNPVPLSPSAH